LSRSSNAQAALSAQVFQILLSLADGPLHGYAIVQDIQRRTDGAVRLTASTLYDALARLVDQGLIAELGERPDASDHDGRRRYYSLAPAGRRAAMREADRLESLLEMARAKRLAPRTRTGVRR
jgi:DNA-binding PadR family transcriptional regulator